MLSKEDINDKFSYPAYSSDSMNNGIVGYTDKPEFICDDQTPVYVTFGDHTRAMNIARKSFSVLDNVKVLLPTYKSNRVLLYIFAVWKKQIPNLGYARHWKFAKDCILELPSKNGSLDAEFIEAFVAELEAYHIAELEAYHLAELEAYLSVTGLNDYTLTEEEENALKNLSCNTIAWGEFTYRDIFNNIEQGRRLKKADHISGKIPFVMSGTTNNGVVDYIENPVASFPMNSITVDIFGNAFYRNYQFGAGDDTGVYWNDKIDYSYGAMLFFTTAIEKSIRGKYSYGKKLRSSQSFQFRMKLPKKGDSPDYEYMALLISAVQKLVIKDVVLYSDQKMVTTKKVVSKLIED